MNIDFLEQCYGTQVFWALEMLSVNVASATLNFSSVHLVFFKFRFLWTLAFSNNDMELKYSVH